MSLEERVKKLEKEVERLRKLIEKHLSHHGSSPGKPNIPPEDPYKPDHEDLKPPKRFEL